MTENGIYTAQITSTTDEAVLNDWKAIYNQYSSILQPSKKTVSETLEYIKSKYPTQEVVSGAARKVAELNAAAYAEHFSACTFKANAPLEITVLLIKNEGKGKTLYDRQEHDYYDSMAEYKRILADVEEFPFEKSPIYVFAESKSRYAGVEGSLSLADEIILFQGLNVIEMKNLYLFARYVQLLKKNNQLHTIINDSL